MTGWVGSAASRAQENLSGIARIEAKTAAVELSLMPRDARSGRRCRYPHHDPTYIRLDLVLAEIETSAALLGLTSQQKNEERLSERETEVLRLLTGSYSNAEIASALRISAGIVKNQVSNILSKFGVRDRVRAVLHGIELGYVAGSS